METEQERKEKMNQRHEPDSWTISTPSSPTGSLKAYFNLEDLETTQKKVENLIKLKKFIEQVI